ncbi:hypothetical protein VTO73DRAFT_11366 [Trametes versicolor]
MLMLRCITTIYVLLWLWTAWRGVGVGVVDSRVRWHILTFLLFLLSYSSFASLLLLSQFPPRSAYLIPFFLNPLSLVCITPARSSSPPPPYRIEFPTTRPPVNPHSSRPRPRPPEAPSLDPPEVDIFDLCPDRASERSSPAESPYDSDCLCSRLSVVVFVIVRCCLQY